MIVMPNQKQLFSILLLCTMSHLSIADPLQSEVIQSGLKSYLESNTDGLIKMHDILLNEANDDSQREALNLQILFHEFLISDLSSKKQKKKFSALCISRSDLAAEAINYQAELFALLSACYGFSAESNFFKAASHGIKSGQMMEKWSRACPSRAIAVYAEESGRCKKSLQQRQCIKLPVTSPCTSVKTLEIHVGF